MTRDRKLSGRALAALACVNLGVVTYFLLSFSGRGIGFGPYHIDLDVYRIGGRTWLHGGNLYGPLPPTLAGGAAAVQLSADRGGAARAARRCCR